MGPISSVLPLTSAKGFVSSYDGVSVLTFAGTEPVNFADWILDFSVHLKADGIHAGFDAGVRAVLNTISATLGPRGSVATDKLFITGHSLGGALAAVAALRLAADQIVDIDRIVGIYTFGMPRCGNEQFVTDYRAVGAGALANRTFRMVDGDDIIPQVPPPEQPFGFRHVGCALACTHGAMFNPANLLSDAAEQTPAGQSAPLDLLRAAFRAQPTSDLPKFPGDPWAAVFIDNLPPSMRDHLMDRYLRALGGLY